MSTKYGDTSEISQSQVGGAQTLIGTDGESNFLVGDASFLLMNSMGGNDTLIGGANSPDNQLYGDADTLIRGASAQTSRSSAMPQDCSSTPRAGTTPSLAPRTVIPTGFTAMAP
jgi:hypothetical protein